MHEKVLWGCRCDEQMAKVAYSGGSHKLTAKTSYAFIAYPQKVSKALHQYFVGSSAVTFLNI